MSETSASSDGDGGTADANQDAPDGAPPLPLVVVSAIDPVDGTNFRVCFAYGASPTGADVRDSDVDDVPPYPDATKPMPRSNYAGVALGGGALLALPKARGRSVTPFLLRANRLAQLPAERTCRELLCGDPARCLLPNLDYFRLRTLPALTSANLLVLRGCMPGTTGTTPERCGAGADGGPSGLDWSLMTLPSSAGPPGGSVTWVPIQAAPGLQARVPEGGAVELSFGSLGQAPLVTFDDLPLFGTAPSPRTIPWTADAGSLESEGFRVVVRGEDGGSRWFSLAQVHLESDPQQAPAAYFAGRAPYFVVVLGDPTSAVEQALLPDGGVNPAYDGRGLHVVAFPATTP